jgi:hypothetical protein
MEFSKHSSMPCSFFLFLPEPHAHSTRHFVGGLIFHFSIAVD